MGARIVLIARSKSRGKVTLARLHEKAPDLAHTVHYADLTRISEMKRVAAEIASQEPRIDVLINNAGAMFSSRRLTEDGLEYTFALNHMAYFVVTEGLRERLLASSPARIVNTGPGGQAGFRRPAIGEGFRSHESLWPLQALQHSIHARTRPPLARHGGHRQLPASRFRRDPHR
jgi:NAD(P)-dependent dehydrogenase (short-subunit alcohol dehydrogenase family)